MLGYCMMRSDQVGMAYSLFRRAIEVAPNDPKAYHNIGKIYHDKQKDKDADEWFRKAHKAQPTFAASMEGLGMSALHRADWQGCIDFSNRAIAEDPASMDARVNRGMAYLALKRWREGWRDYDSNLGKEKNRKELIYADTPRWDGSKGKNVVVYGEQGIGDEISFASCLPDLIRDSKSVVIECEKRNLALFKRSFPTCEVFGSRYRDDKDRELFTRRFDGKVALAALPGFYRFKDQDFTGVPYLTPNPDHSRVWRAVLDSLGSKPKIGITWTGGLPHTGQHRRSITLDSYAPLFDAVDADWVSLQYKDTDGIKEAEKKYGIKIHEWELGSKNKDYDQTVALISQLDLVISVCTTVVHAAGAVGKECWCLTPEVPLWRYLAQGEWFPWAKSVKLWRQKNKQWPIQLIAGELRRKYGDRPGHGHSSSQKAA
jgi:hypothetical protein